MILNYVTWDVDPILIHFGDGGIRWYGLLWAIGLYICWAVNERMYKRENCPAEWADLLFFWMAAGMLKEDMMAIEIQKEDAKPKKRLLSSTRF